MLVSNDASRLIGFNEEKREKRREEKRREEKRREMGINIK